MTIRRIITHGLTENMGRVLNSLAEKRAGAGGWFEGCGWVWTSSSGTERMMQSLVKRGFASRAPHPQHYRKTGHYTITPAGAVAAAAFTEEMRKIAAAERAEDDARRGITPEHRRQQRNAAWLERIRLEWMRERRAWQKQLMIDALSSIAAGHNDPRSLATETLALIDGEEA